MGPRKELHNINFHIFKKIVYSKYSSMFHFIQYKFLNIQLILYIMNMYVYFVT